MAPPVSLPLRSTLASLALALGAGCATTTASEAPATTAATAAAARVADPEVVVLRERVARLEKRLADVDGKLALLLARAETPPTLTTTAPVRVAQVGTPSPPPPGPSVWELSSGGADAGLRSVDIERTSPARDENGIVFDDGDDDDGGTVVLQMHGDQAPVITHGGGSRDDTDPLSALRSAKDLYGWGQARLKEGRHLEAVAAFEDIVSRFPGDDLADNSLYWIGVCHQARGEHRLAIAEWQKLPARFPASPKIPDALYGMAASHEALGEPAVAEVLYDEILASYPKAEKYPDAKKAIARLRPSR